MKFHIVVAVNQDSLIGIREYDTFSLPWPLIQEDAKFFKTITTTTKLDLQKNAIIMGRNTWTSLPDIYKKNVKRQNIIITSDVAFQDIGAIGAKSFAEAFEKASQLDNIDSIFVIGGGLIYDVALSHCDLDKIFVTKINNSYPRDNEIEQEIYFPITLEQIDSFVNSSLLTNIYQSDVKTEPRSNITYQFNTYSVSSQFTSEYKKLQNVIHALHLVPNTIHDHAENQYIDLVKKIMTDGLWKNAQNGKIKSIFGSQHRYDLSLGYPIPTIKRSYPKSIFEELMWILRGSTNVKELQAKGVHIWDKNSSQDFLIKNGLLYVEGDIGPGYGFQMRHFGAVYVDCFTNYAGLGVDQLIECIDLINNNPKRSANHNQSMESNR